MHQANHQRHLHPLFKPTTVTVDKPVVCVIHSEEVAKLGEVLQSDFPLIYDILGGVEGLMNCITYSEVPANEYSKDTEQTYEELSTSTYTVIEDIIEGHGNFTSDGFIIGDVETEFISWAFYDYLAAAASVYQKLLFELLCSLRKQQKDVSISRVTPTRLKNIYYIEFTPKDI